MAKIKIKLLFLALISALSVGIFTTLSSGRAFAEGETTSSNQNAVFLQVSPAKQKISLSPGETYQGSFIVQNAGTGDFGVDIYSTPFSVSNDNYNPDYSESKTYSQMADWITFDLNPSVKGTQTIQEDNTKNIIKLSPGQTATVGYTVKVPKDVPAGAQYAALMAQNFGDQSTDGSSIQALSRVGMILYAEMKGGETRIEGEITSNTVSNFYLNPPITVSSSVKNTGNVEATAQYTLKITPFFGGESVYNNEENPGVKDIYPETTYVAESTWEGAPHLGAFWVEQTIEFPKGNFSTNKQLVIICPLWLIFIILAIIFFIIFMIVSRIRNHSKGSSHGRIPSENETKSFRDKE